MASLLKANGDILVIQPKRGNTFELEELQALVGGHIQVISIPEYGELMIMDEEAKVKLPRKPINRNATTYAIDVLQPGDFIAGDVVVCLTTMMK